jgi:hypothetical protein
MFKRPMHLFFIVFFVLFSHQAWSSIGSIVLATGKVDIQRANQMIEAQTGSALEAQDKIFTRSGARAQLRFNDDTVITLGSNTEFGIDSFLNEGSNKAEAKFNIAKGTFKAITGKVGKAAPQNFTVKTRTATIGVRGTIFRGRITPTREMIATLSGLIFVMEDQTGQLVEVPAGQFTNVFPGQPPIPPMPLTNQQLQELNEGEDEQGNEQSENNDQGNGQNDNNDALLGDAGGLSNGGEQQTPDIDNSLINQALKDNTEDQINESLPQEQTVNVDLVGWEQVNPDYLSDLPYPDDFNVDTSAQILDDKVGWGSWADEYGEVNYWVGGLESVDAANYVSSLMGSQDAPTYNYQGEVIGNVLYGSNSYQIGSSSVVLSFDFGSSSFNGQVGFDAGDGGIWSVGFNSEFNSEGFYSPVDMGYVTGGVGDFDHTVGGMDSYLEGMFYGSKASAVGGVFSFQADEGQGLNPIEAYGVFKAVKQ